MFLKSKLVLLMLVTFFLVHVRGLDCDAIFQNAEFLNNKMISSLNLWSRTGLGSSADCVNDCARYSTCVSVFYNNITDTCVAHGVQFYSADFSVDEEGSLYFTMNIVGIQGFDCDAIFHNAEFLNNKMISSLNLWSRTGLGSAADCVNDCARYSTCVSVFYNNITDTCVAHGVQFYSADFSVDEEGSLYFTTNIDKRNCDDILSIDPNSPTGVYVINPNDGLGHAGVYCDMPVSEGEWSVIEDCSDILLTDPDSTNGVYFVKPGSDIGHFRVYCDMTQHGGGWTVFQRREDNSVNFNQNWNKYKVGFGNPGGEFWLGNDFISRLSSQKPSQLRIDMRDKADESGFATYSNFRVDNEAAKYKLTVTGFAGDRGDSLEDKQNGMSFSTPDRDNDAVPGFSCAAHWAAGGWWMAGCFWSNLNGNHGNDGLSKGIIWNSWHGFEYSLLWAEMKMKPA